MIRPSRSASIVLLPSVLRALVDGQGGRRARSGMRVQQRRQRRVREDVAIEDNERL
jgi:hypothetical protein